GLHELHKLRIVHRDVKAENILLTPSGHLTFGDFGLSDVYPLEVEWDPATQPVGTVPYMAPELLAFPGQRRLGQYKADIFALALVILEIL
ncbi:hypothetical protein HYDPIDRAFT_53748, partial [Hydnomerulius pinastri MD-312]